MKCVTSLVKKADFSTTQHVTGLVGKVIFIFSDLTQMVGRHQELPARKNVSSCTLQAQEGYEDREGGQSTVTIEKWTREREREKFICMKKLQATKRASAHQRWCLF